MQVGYGNLAKRFVIPAQLILVGLWSLVELDKGDNVFCSFEPYATNAPLGCVNKALVHNFVSDCESSDMGGLALYERQECCPVYGVCSEFLTNANVCAVVH